MIKILEENRFEGLDNQNLYRLEQIINMATDLKQEVGWSREQEQAIEQAFSILSNAIVI